MPIRKPGRMKKIGNETFQETDQNLADQEVEMLLNTSIDWESLRPQITNQTIYNSLMTEVKDSTQRNESAAQLKNRIQK